MKRKTDNFNKFYNKKRNSAVKEEFRQEKKAEKKERKQAIERRFEEKRQAKGLQQPPAGRAGSSHPAGRPSAAGLAGGRKSASYVPNDGQRGKAPVPPAGKPLPMSHHDQELRGDLIPLNKYIAHGGICSRRDAAELIRLGKVQVNGQPVTEPGTKVASSDLVKVNGKKVTISRNFVYILLNKPKDYITTTDDPLGRKTVLDLIRHATEERVFPVGRLDRNTSGVLLLTNDGDLSQKLAHPSHEIKKIYHVVLDKPLTKADFDKIIGGEVHLEDGIANVDAMAYEDAQDRTQIGLEIHSGRNRIVRRIFEHLGYDVRGLDRVMYAGLTKKNVQRGKWRLLVEKEVRILKYLNSSIKGSAARAKDWDANQGDMAGAGDATRGSSALGARSSRGGKSAPKTGKRDSVGAAGLAAGLAAGRKATSYVPPHPVPGNQLIDPEGLLTESEASHFSKKKRMASGRKATFYAPSAATGKRGHAASGRRDDKRAHGAADRPASDRRDDNRAHKASDRSTSDRSTSDRRDDNRSASGAASGSASGRKATYYAPPAATGKRSRKATGHPGKPGPSTGAKRSQNAAPGAKRSNASGTAAGRKATSYVPPGAKRSKNAAHGARRPGGAPRSNRKEK